MGKAWETRRFKRSDGCSLCFAVEHRAVFQCYLWFVIYSFGRKQSSGGKNPWISSPRILQMPCPFLKPVSMMFKNQRARVLSGCLLNLLAAPPLMPQGFTFQCLPLLRFFFFFKGVRWLVSKQLLRMGAIAIDGCKTGRRDTEGLWQSQHTHLIRNCCDAKVVLLSQCVTAEMLICYFSPPLMK